MFKKLLVYLGGLASLSLGSVLCIKSALGVSPITTLPSAISEVSSLSIGMASAMLFSLYVLIQILILKKDFQKIQLLQILFGILFGQIINLFNRLINLNSEWFLFNLGILVIGIILTSIGVTLTISAGLVPVAPDGLTKVLAERLNKPFGTVKITFDVLVICIAVVILLVFRTSSTIIGLGTIISAICTGKLVDKFLRIKEKIISI